MSSKTILYDILSILMLLGSLFFFYLSTDFLVGKDYIAATIAAFIGIVIIRTGVELGKLALLARRRKRESA